MWNLNYCPRFVPICYLYDVLMQVATFLAVRFPILLALNKVGALSAPVGMQVPASL